LLYISVSILIPRDSSGKNIVSKDSPIGDAIADRNNCCLTYMVLPAMFLMQPGELCIFFNKDAGSQQDKKDSRKIVPDLI
jgi:hypothetical protein